MSASNPSMTHPPRGTGRGTPGRDGSTAIKVARLLRKLNKPEDAALMLFPGSRNVLICADEGCSLKHCSVRLPLLSPGVPK